MEKDYEEYIAELETELSEAKGEIERLEDDFDKECEVTTWFCQKQAAQIRINEHHLGFE